MTPADVAFYVLALLVVVAAGLSITLRNVARALLAQIVFFVCIAGLYFTLRAEFIGAVQLLVYVGAVAVLIVFAIVLTRTGEGRDEDGATPRPRRFGMRALGALGAALTGAVLIALVMRAQIGRSARAVAETNVDALGESLMTRYALPFEIASLLLTAALVGAVVIAVDEIRRLPR